MAGEGLRGLRMEVGPDAGVNIERAAFAVSAADRLDQRVGRLEAELDSAAWSLILPGAAEGQSAAVLFFAGVAGLEKGLPAFGRVGRPRELHLRELAIGQGKAIEHLFADIGQQLFISN